MEKIIAVTFDIADQKCKMYNALEWHNFIADTREQAEDPSAELEDLFDEVYGDEFWWEANEWSQKLVYAVAFDLISEEFVVCQDDNEVDFVMEMAWASDRQDEIFWAE
jgi:hypothetical protein